MGSFLSLTAACTTVTEAERNTVVQLPISQTQEIDAVAATNGTAKIIMFRSWNGEGLLFLPTGPMVLIDGQEIGRCLLGDGSEHTIAAGEHVIRSLSSDISERPFQISAGQTALVECKYTAGALSPNVEFIFTTTRG